MSEYVFLCHTSLFSRGVTVVIVRIQKNNRDNMIKRCTKFKSELHQEFSSLTMGNHFVRNIKCMISAIVCYRERNALEDYASREKKTF